MCIINWTSTYLTQFKSFNMKKFVSGWNVLRDVRTSRKTKVSRRWRSSLKTKTSMSRDETRRRQYKTRLETVSRTRRSRQRHPWFEDHRIVQLKQGWNIGKIFAMKWKGKYTMSCEKLSKFMLFIKAELDKIHSLKFIFRLLLSKQRKWWIKINADQLTSDMQVIV